MRLAYYPGCTLASKAKAFDQTARWVAQKLGIELVALPEWQCCGGLVPQVTDAVMGLLAPIRILADAQAKRQTHDLVFLLLQHLEAGEPCHPTRCGEEAKGR